MLAHRTALLVVSALAWISVGASAAHAAQAQVAVAANFAEPFKAIAAVLVQTTGHTLKVSTGASGAFYTQIKNGAPFDVFLSADNERPEMLEKEGLAVPGTRFTYATGKLALWSLRVDRVDPQGQVLRAPDLGKVAYANPKTAPYGEAAVQVMNRMGLTTTLTPLLVQGESIGQTYNFVKTGNADVGFVALSQVLHNGRLKEGSVWVVPQSYHAPIQQDAVLLRKGAQNEAAFALIKLLQSPHIKDLIRSYGYDL
ncbi:MAG: Molybdate-binding periplasmic protein precursor [Pseudomonadota bacterium]